MQGRAGERGTGSSGSPGAAAATPLGARLGFSSTGWLLLHFALALVAYHRLLAFEARPALDFEAESWLFEPQYISPPVIAALSGWLVLRRWGLLRRLPAQTAPVWMIGFLLGTAGLVLAWATFASAPDLLALSLALGLLGFGALFRGIPGVRALLLPVVVLLLALPVPAPLFNELIFALQIGTADYTGWLLRKLGVAVFVSGDLIVHPEQKFAVIEGCSGFRSMETLTIVAVLLVDLFRRRGLHAALVVLSAPPLAFFLNGMRAIALILNPHAELVTIHTLQGVVILLIGLVLLYGLDGLLAWALPGRHAGAPVEATPGDEGPRQPPRLCARVTATAVLAAGAAAALWLPTWEVPPAPPVWAASDMRTTFDGWRGKDLFTDRIYLGRVGIGPNVHRQYRRDGQEVKLFVGVGDRSERLRSVLSPKTVRPGSGWIVEQTRPVTLPPDGRRVTSHLLRSQARRVLVYHWYVGSRGVAEEALRALLAVDRSPLRRPGESYVVRLSTELVGPAERAREQAEGVLQRFLAPLDGELDSLERRLRRKRIS